MSVSLFYDFDEKKVYIIRLVFLYPTPNGKMQMKNLMLRGKTVESLTVDVMVFEFSFLVLFVFFISGKEGICIC